MTNLKITSAGISAANAAQNNGFDIEITEIGLGSGHRIFDLDMTALVTESKRLAAHVQTSAQGNVAHISCIDESTDEYQIHELGLFLSDGTLFAYFSDSSPINVKTASSFLPIAFNLVIKVDGLDFTISDSASFIIPHAREISAGIIRIAPQSLAADGVDAITAITPKTLKFIIDTKIKRASISGRGLIEIATSAEAIEGIDNTRAITPSGVKQSILKNVPDATTAIYGKVRLTAADDNDFDNQSYAMTLKTFKALMVYENLTGSPEKFDPKDHNHTANDIISGVLNINRIPNLPASKITSGTISALRLPPASTAVKGIIEKATSAEARTGTDSLRAVTPSGVKAAINDHLPIGAILMWAGSVAAIPAKYKLCNGANGTPDLRNRFIIGAGGSHNPRQTGGANQKTTSSNGGHNHTASTSVNVQDHILTIAEMPRHSHDINAVYESFSDNMSGADSEGFKSTHRDNYVTTLNSGGGGGHDHGASASTRITAGGSHNHSVDVRPPFYALCFIMKIS